MNLVLLHGRLGKDPELRHTTSGKAVTNFSVATEESWDGQDGNRQKKVEWHRIVVWGKTAENCEKYLAKGSPVFIEGRIQSREYQDKDGNDRKITEVVAFKVQFLAHKEDGGGKGNRDEDGFSTTPLDSDLPF